MEIKKKLIDAAEVVDAWRVVPRLVLIMYSYLVIELYRWFISIPTYVEKTCSAQVMQFLTDKGMDLDQINAIACTVSDVVGGPTTAQSAFVTTIIGLSTGIFGLYASTGRKWGKDKNAIASIPPIVVNYPHTGAKPPTEPEKDTPSIPIETDGDKFEP